MLFKVYKVIGVFWSFLWSSDDNEMDLIVSSIIFQIIFKKKLNVKNFARFIELHLDKVSISHSFSQFILYRLVTDYL